jgi:hypothetical protein
VSTYSVVQKVQQTLFPSVVSRFERTVFDLLWIQSTFYPYHHMTMEHAMTLSLYSAIVSLAWAQNSVWTDTISVGMTQYFQNESIDDEFEEASGNERIAGNGGRLIPV